MWLPRLRSAFLSQNRSKRPNDFFVLRLRPSHSFAPSAIVCVLEFHGDRSVWIHELFACPCDGTHDSGTNLNLSGEVQRAHVSFRNQKRGLPQSAAMRMTG